MTEEEALAEYEYAKEMARVGGAKKPAESPFAALNSPVEEVAEPAARPEIGAPAEAALQGVGQGMSFGFLPWLQARAEQGANAVANIGGGERPTDFEKLRQEWVARNDALREGNTKSFIGGNIIGAVANPANIAMAGAAAPATVGAALGTGALMGARQGAIQGLGEMTSRDEGVGRFLGETAAGGVFGGALGGAFKGGGDLVKKYGSKIADAITEFAAKNQGRFQEIADEQSFKAALEPYFSDTKELRSAASRAMGRDEAIPSMEAVREAGRYLRNEGLVPKTFSNPEATAKALLERKNAAGRMMGEQIDVADEFLEQIGWSGIPKEDVARRLKSALKERRTIGMGDESAAIREAMGKILSTPKATSTLRELQTGKTAFGNAADYAKENLEKQANVWAQRATGKTMKDILGKMSEPGFKDDLAEQWAQELARREAAAAAAARPPAQPYITDIMDALPGGGQKLLPGPAGTSPNIPGASYGPRGTSSATGIGVSPNAPRMPDIPDTDLSGLLRKYEQGAEGFGRDAGLLDIARAGQERRWFNRLLSPTGKASAMTGAIGGMVAGGPVGAAIGGLSGAVGGLGLQRAAAPLMTRAALGAKDYLDDTAANLMRRSGAVSRAANMASQYVPNAADEISRLLGITDPEEREELKTNISSQHFTGKQ